MTMRLKRLKTLLLCIFLIPSASFAEVGDDPIDELQIDWAVANYKLSGDKQEQAFEALIAQADDAVAEHPDSAEILIWNGIIKSSYAGTKGGLGALSLAKQAKKSLEGAIEVNGAALNGSAYTSLGTLYFKVPGWPLGFGSDKKAAKLLEKALEINPDGIDSNYFYADYLLHKKEFAMAEKYLLKAQEAAPREGRPLADLGRRKEILVALSLAREKHQRSGS